jgi:two-component system nitrate/nitrite response regulator NarL
MLADGHSAREIADRLFLSTSTIKTHLHNLYEKLGVTDRAAAVAEGMRRGVLR